MKLRKLALAAAVFVGLSGMAAGAASAQQKIFVIDEARIRSDTKVGKEMAAVLGGIYNQGVDKLGLKTLNDEIKTESDALRPQAQSLTPEALNANPTLKARVDALNKKASELAQRRDYLNANVNQEGQALNGMFATVMEPAVQHVAKQQGADIVLSASSTWYVKDAVDISSKVVARLDATIPSLKAMQDAYKASLPAQPAAAPAASAAPAAPAPATPPKPQGGQ
jgi:Skp family chaperone for outer membrane proteins